MSKEEKVLSNFKKINEVKNYIENTHSLTIALDLIEKDQRIAELEKENEQLKSELESFKQNVIVPKFKVGDVIWIIKRIKKEVDNGKIIKQYSYFNGGTPENLRNVNRWRIRLKNNSEVTKKEYELFYTSEEAEEALKKLEENKND